MMSSMGLLSAGSVGPQVDLLLLQYKYVRTYVRTYVRVRTYNVMSQRTFWYVRTNGTIGTLVRSYVRTKVHVYL